jgi:hypothetical protein
MSQHNVERYLGGVEAWNRGSLDEWLQRTATPGWELVTGGAFPGLAPVYRGREGGARAVECVAGTLGQAGSAHRRRAHRRPRRDGGSAADHASQWRSERCARGHPVGSRHHLHGRRSADTQLRELGRRPASRRPRAVGDVAGGPDRRAECLSGARARRRSCGRRVLASRHHWRAMEGRPTTSARCTASAPRGDTCEPAALSVFSVMTLREGLITQLDEFLDRVEALEAVGRATS